MIINSDSKVYFTDYNPDNDSITTIFNIISQHEIEEKTLEIKNRFSKSSKLLVKSLFDNTILGVAICSGKHGKCLVYIDSLVHPKIVSNIQELLRVEFNKKYSRQDHFKFISL